MNYQLHDSQINDLSICNNKIVLHFSEGFWETDAKGKEVSQKQNCKLVFSIDNELNLPIENFIFIRVCKSLSNFSFPLSIGLSFKFNNFSLSNTKDK